MRRIPYKYIVAVVFVFGLFMDLLDMTITNVALPTLAPEFGASTTTIEWVVTGYLLSLAVFIPVSGWAGDRFGTKRVFMFALSVFIAGLAPLRPRLEHRVADRLPGAAGRRRRHADPRRHGHALSRLPARGAGAGRRGADHPHGAGPGQRTGARRLPGRVPLLALDLPGEHPRRHRRPAAGRGSSCARRSRPTAGRLDVPGFLLAAAGLASVMYALAEAGPDGFGDRRVILFGLSGLALTAVFAVVELRSNCPMIDVRLLARQAVQGGERRAVRGLSAACGGAVPPAAFPPGGEGAEPAGVGPHHLSPGHRRGHDGAARRAPLPSRRAAPDDDGRHGRRRPEQLLPSCWSTCETSRWWIQLIMLARGWSFALTLVPLQAATFATIRSRTPAARARCSTLTARWPRASASPCWPRC